MAKKSTDWGRFSAPETSDARNILWSSQGRGGSGKTHFGLTAPDPIAVMLFDPGGLKGLTSNPLFSEKDVRVIDYSKIINPGKLAEDDRPKASQDVLAQFEEDWATALVAARTILWDKEDHVWEMLRYANLEGYTDRPANYYELNMKYRGWFTEAEAAGVNFGVIRGLKERWGKTGVNRQTGQPTFGSLGEFDPRGMKEVPELVQVNLAHEWDGDAREFKVRILEKCRVGDAVSLLGQEFGGLDFPTLASVLFPESELSEWGY